VIFTTAAVLACVTTHAQTLTALPAATESATSSSSAELLLPDAPGIVSENSARSNNSRALPAAEPFSQSVTSSNPSRPEASHTQEIIDPGQHAPSLNSGDKVLLGLRSSFSPLSAIGWVASAGYEQLLNGSPNYGTDRGAFGQRLGASFIRATSENLLSESIFAPILREDPRYYRLGKGHSFPSRVVYSITRPLVNRTDKGTNMINFAQLGGNLGGAEMTYLYYPKSNQSQGELLETFGGSVGGNALGYFVHEFWGDFADMVRHRQN
jgi:hypothetical protein